jgi:single-strand DNA-binding protein
MAKSMAVICLTGHLTRDAELKSTASGKSVLKFGLAVNTGYNDSARVTFYNCDYWGKAENLAQYLVKGALIAVTGEPSLREYSVDSGKRQSLDVRVSDIILLGSKKDAAPADDDHICDGDVPF